MAGGEGVTLVRTFDPGNPILEYRIIAYIDVASIQDEDPAGARLPCSVTVYQVVLNLGTEYAHQGNATADPACLAQDHIRLTGTINDLIVADGQHFHIAQLVGVGQNEFRDNPAAFHLADQVAGDRRHNDTGQGIMNQRSFHQARRTGQRGGIVQLTAQLDPRTSAL